MYSILARLKKIFIDQRKSTMLTLYAFLIFALGSSVIAMPTNQKLDKQPYGEPWLLENNIDRRLPAGLWGRLIVQDVQQEQAPPIATWTVCDDFIQFISPDWLVKGMSIHRVVRQFETKQVRGPNGLENEYKYTVPPTKRTEVVYDKVPPSKWGAFLRDTYWGRVPKVVGVVSDGVVIWQS